jgi:hypothetical protein
MYCLPLPATCPVPLDEEMLAEGTE